MTVYEKTYPHKRYNITLDFLKKHIDINERILDLGVSNPFTEIMKANGYEVENTMGEDLDDDYTAVSSFKGEVVTAFEIFEHLVAPYNVLKNISCDKLLVSVPLRLWFSNAYRNKQDIRDQHYHEFEPWQLDYVLEKAGWEIKNHMKFTNPVKKLGLRPILRKFTDRYYLVYCERAKN
jgi:hypothetical protein